MSERQRSIAAGLVCKIWKFLKLIQLTADVITQTWSQGHTLKAKDLAAKAKDGVKANVNMVRCSVKTSNTDVYCRAGND